MLNLKKLRTQKGISQQALADEFNLSQQSIYKYENGLAEPDIQTLKEFAKYFNVTIDYLVGFADHADAEPEIPSKNISNIEIEVIEKLRQLQPEVRSSLMTLIDHLKVPQKTD